MENHHVAHEVAPGGPGSPGGHVVDHGNLVIDVYGQVKRHRHQAWASFSTPMCIHCLQNHTRTHQVHYPVAAVGNEVCQCPCRVEEGTR